MKGLAVLYLVFICKICSAGFPWCFKTGNNGGNGVNFNVIDISKSSAPNVHIGGSRNEKFFCPKVDKSIVSVVEGQLPIWKAGEGDVCTLVKVKTRGDDPVAIKMSIIKNGHPCVVIFVKSDGEWKEHDPSQNPDMTVPSIGFVSEADKVPDLSLVKLSISNPNDVSIESHEDGINGAKRRVYEPRDGFKVTCVTDDGTTLWKAPKGERCTFVELFTRDGQKLLYLEIDCGQKFEPKYFESHGGPWIHTTKEAFNTGFANIMKLRKEETKSVSSLGQLRGVPKPSLDDVVMGNGEGRDGKGATMPSFLQIGATSKEYMALQTTPLEAKKPAGHFVSWSTEEHITTSSREGYVGQSSSVASESYVCTNDSKYKSQYTGIVCTDDQMTSESQKPDLDYILIPPFQMASFPANTEAAPKTIPLSSLQTRESLFRFSIHDSGTLDYLPIPPKNMSSQPLELDNYSHDYVSRGFMDDLSGETVSGATREDSTSRDAGAQRFGPSLDYVSMPSPGYFLRSSEDDVEQEAIVHYNILDIANPTDDLIVVQERENGEVTQKVYAPKDGANITCVLYGTEEVWLAEQGQNCTFLESSTRGGNVLVYLEVYDKSDFRPKFFEKRSEWKELNLVEFSDRLKQMRSD